MIDDWKCTGTPTYQECEEIIGETRRVRITQMEDTETTFIFSYPGLDQSKLESGKVILGISRVVSGPWWWPFGKKVRVYQYEYPIKSKI